MDIFHLQSLNRLGGVFLPRWRQKPVTLRVCRAIGLFLLGTITVFIISACHQQVDQNATSNISVAASGAPSPAAARVVKHALGETKVPVNPQRVVTLESSSLEAALVLGFKPVGAASWVGGGHVGDLPSFLKEEIEGTKYLGKLDQPNLEKIALVQPDLILGDRFAHENIYNRLKQIAPTVLYGQQSMIWKDYFRSYAEALGKTAEAEKILSDYNQRVAQLKQQMGERFASTQVSLVRFLPGEVRLYTKDFLKESILQEKNLKWQVISLESIPELDNDVIFLVQSEPDATLYQRFTSNPLWQQLGAVKSGRVYQVNYEYWIGGDGPISANLILDDLFRYLVEKKQ